MTLNKKRIANANTIACMQAALKLAEEKLKQTAAPLVAADAELAKAQAAYAAEGNEANGKLMAEAQAAVSKFLGDQDFCKAMAAAEAGVAYRTQDLAKQMAFKVRKAVR